MVSVLEGCHCIPILVMIVILASMNYISTDSWSHCMRLVRSIPASSPPRHLSCKEPKVADVMQSDCVAHCCLPSSGYFYMYVSKRGFVGLIHTFHQKKTGGKRLTWCDLHHNTIQREIFTLCKLSHFSWIHVGWPPRKIKKS